MKYTLLGAITAKGTNSAVVRLKYRAAGVTDWTTVQLAANATTISYSGVILSSVIFDAGTSYEVVAEIVDKMVTASAQRVLAKVPNTQLYYYKPNGRALGIGMQNDVDYSLRIGWATWFDEAMSFSEDALAALIATLVSGGVWDSAHLKIQTGTFTSASGGVTITFPTPFPSSPLGVFVILYTTNPAYWSDSTLGATSVKLYVSSSGVSCRWIAVWVG